MWRSFFLAVGIASCLTGGEALILDKAVLASGTSAELGQPAGSRDIRPPEWAPWSLLSGGAVVILYSFTLPKKLKE
jgi:hypothetical protein